MGQWFSWVKSNEKELLVILENLAKKAVEASDAVLELMDDPTNKDKKSCHHGTTLRLIPVPLLTEPFACH